MSWTTTPEAPTREHGPSWSTAATVPARAHGPGWFALSEKLVQFTSTGALSATVEPHYSHNAPQFGGLGTLSAVITGHFTRAAQFTTAGVLTAEVAQRRAVAAAFSAAGSLTAEINDGLSAIIYPSIAVAAAFGAEGSLSCLFNDGLSATVEPGASAGAIPADFTAAGALTADAFLADGLVAAIRPGEAAAPSAIAAFLAGSGTLSATVIRRHLMSAALAGSGSLSATVAPSFASSAALSGGGTLSATVEEGAPAGPAHLTGVTYSQSSCYSEDSPATYAGMNDNSASAAGNGQTGIEYSTPAYLEADLGATKHVDHVVIGYNYLDDLPGGWGTSFLDYCTFEYWDGSAWQPVGGTVPDYASSGAIDGLLSMPIDIDCQRLRIIRYDWISITEFQIWGD